MLTDRGWAALGASLALFVLWAALGEPELLSIGLLLAVATTAAFVFVRRSNPSVAVTRRLSPNLVHEGEQTVVEASLTNVGARRVWNLTAEDDVAGLGSARFAAARLAPDETATATYQILCKPRGIYDVGPLRVSVTDPLRLADRSQLVGQQDRLIVYPAVEQLSGLPVLRGLDPSMYASQPEFSHRGGEDFYTLREYQTGDDLRRVHWPSTAKRDELMIRQLETPWQSRALVFFDPRGSSYDGTEAFERAVSGAASVVRHMLSSGFDADLWTGGAPISSAEPGSYAKSMEALAGVQPTDGLDLRAAALRLQRGGRGGALVLITGSPDGELLAVGQLLTRNFASTVLMSVAQQASATVAHFQRAGTQTMAIKPDGSWAKAWLNAAGTPWPTVSAG
ncbi:MAG: DUF58 domain-containing protein [Acidimicrobiia bacterium]|nr:DUF58 domain-containing protein [Acidimicrobiia bacterium]MDH3397201.1 DUF58 domain-containing protein [Acidimicrobiia bacterium]MDH5615288.1 DUF58 domain-containing protein [Acidimicrobiia bacterium]